MSWAVPVQSDGFNSALSPVRPVVFGDIAHIALEGGHYTG